MTDAEDKKPIEYYRARPENYTITRAGSVQDRATGQFVAMFPELNPNAITTPERGRELAAMRRAYGLRSKMLGLIDDYNEAQEREEDRINPDELTDEELIVAAGDAIRLQTKLIARSVRNSTNPRNQAEGYRLLVEPFAEDPTTRSPIPPPSGMIYGAPSAILELARRIELEQAERLARSQAIEGHTREGE